VLTAMHERELHGWRLTDHRTMSKAGYGAKVRSTDWLRRPMTPCHLRAAMWPMRRCPAVDPPMRHNRALAIMAQLMTNGPVPVD
jgi:hypothetical protein